MPHLTKAQWQAQIDECGGELSQDDLINLIFKEGPNALWSDVVKEKHVSVYGVYEYLTRLFPTRVWNDWIGTDEFQRTYYSPFIPFDMGIFQRSMLICDPANMNECHTDYCSIPKGGIQNMPPPEMYKTGFKTEPMCIANIRTSRSAKDIALKIINERFAVDEQVMNAFFTMAVIRMMGHKWILEYELNSSGEPVPVTSGNPYNILGGYRYNFMHPLFPQVGNIANVMPLDIRFLQMFGSALTNSRNQNFVAKGSRGEPIFELWIADDVYRQEVLDNPEFIEANKKYMPEGQILPFSRGYTLEAPDREVIGNFALRMMPQLPRFAESTEGGLAVIQQYNSIPIDHGTRPYHNFREWDNAPFLLTLAIGKGAGEILTRPSLTTGIEGRPIMPIEGNGEWVYRNDYDKDCNEDLNKPHFRKRYEMGFRMLDPDAGWAFLHRAKKFRLRPFNACDLRDTFVITPQTQDCSILTIGCNPLNERVSNNIIEGSNARKLVCESVICGDDTIWRLTFRRENWDAITPDQNPMYSCVCGDDVTLLVGGDGEGVTSQVQGELIEYLRPNLITPHPVWYVKLDAPLDAGDCIKAVVCQDETPTVGNVVGCFDNETIPELGTTKLKVALDSLLSCDVGDTVTVTWYDAENVSLGTKSATISAFDPNTFIYELTSTAPFECDAFEGQVRMTVTCA